MPCKDCRQNVYEIIEGGKVVATFTELEHVITYGENEGVVRAETRKERNKIVVRLVFTDGETCDIWFGCPGGAAEWIRFCIGKPVRIESLKKQRCVYHYS